MQAGSESRGDETVFARRSGTVHARIIDDTDGTAGGGEVDIDVLQKEMAQKRANLQVHGDVGNARRRGCPLLVKTIVVCSLSFPGLTLTCPPYVSHTPAAWQAMLSSAR